MCGIIIPQPLDAQICAEMEAVLLYNKFPPNDHRYKIYQLMFLWLAGSALEVWM